MINTTNHTNNTTTSTSGSGISTGTSNEQEERCKAEGNTEELENEVEEDEEEEYVLEGYQCILCRGNIYKPTCTPCGHLYCWECLISLISSSSTLKLKPPIPTTPTTLTTLANITTRNNIGIGSSSSSNVSGGSSGVRVAGLGLASSKDGYFYVKCPSCRHVFLPQQIRTLYHFQ